MKKHIIKLIIPVLALFVVSCSSDDDSLDSSAPTIVVEEPTMHEEFALGDEIHFDALFTDDVELASYKIDIHNNFDGHEHRGVVPYHNDEPWTYQESFTIPHGNTEYHVHQHIDIPNNILPGDYHFGVILIDAAGNESQVYLEIVIGDDNTDTGIVIDDLNVDDVARGGMIHVDAHIDVPNEVDYILINIHGHGLNPSDGEIRWEYDDTIDSYTGTHLHFHEHIDVPENAAIGEYHLSITVVDRQGGVNTEGVLFQVTD